MNQSDYLHLIRGERRGFFPSLARGGLTAVAAGYRIVVAGRNRAYDTAWFRAEPADVPVIAVGNLTLGGTGKTPMVEYLARRCRQAGLRVALLSRGYGQTEGLNDEGRVLEDNLPDVPHLQGRNRAALARVAVHELASQILVLDDGFQHRRLGRDLDVVLLDALQPFGLGRIFPRGLLREPISGLRRADLVVLSRADLVPPDTRRDIRAEAERRAGPLRWVEARQAPLDLVGTEGPVAPADSLAGRRVAAFCGIGNPEGFRRTLEQLGAHVAAFRPFPDHHPYGAHDVAELSNWCHAQAVDLALTTQKDFVKLRADRLGPVPLRALRIGMELIQGAEALDEVLAPVIDRALALPDPLA